MFVYVLTKRTGCHCLSHVDDYVVVTNSADWYDSFLKAFRARCNVNDIGEVKNLLASGVTWYGQM